MFLRALDLDPNAVFAHGYLGTSYAFSGNCDAALPHLDEAIRLSPRDPLLVIWHLCKGWAALLTQRYEEAVEFATLAAEANPESGTAKFGRIVVARGLVLEDRRKAWVHSLAATNDDMSRLGVMHPRGVGRRTEGDQKA